jgi:hypothetical protein
MESLCPKFVEAIEICLQLAIDLVQFDPQSATHPTLMADRIKTRVHFGSFQC